MVMVRFLMLIMLFFNLSAKASMRHACRLLEQPTRILSRSFANFSSREGDRILIHNDPTKKFGNMVNVQCPKDEGSFREITRLCKPTVTYIEKNGKTTQTLTYKRGSDFTDADVDSATRPNIPDLTEIKTHDDILKVAEFIQKYANYMTVHFLRTQDVLGEYVNEHRIALSFEPATLLDLVRPGEPVRIKERVAIRAENALKHTRDKQNQLILLFYRNGINLAFGYFDDIDWKNWYPANKGHIDAVLGFAKAIYKDTPDIEAYKTEEEFNAALMKIDPDFRQLFTENDPLHTKPQEMK